MKTPLIGRDSLIIKQQPYPGLNPLISVKTQSIINTDLVLKTIIIFGLFFLQGKMIQKYD